MKIKLTHFIDSKFYYFNLPYGRFSVNEIDINNNDPNKHYTSEQVPVISSVETRSFIRNYKAVEGDDLSTIEYEEQLEKFRDLSDGDYDGELKFNSLDDEYACKKFTRNYIAIYEKLEIKTPCELEIIESYLSVDDEFVTPVFSIDTSKAHLFTFEKMKFEKKVVKELLESIPKVVEIPSHSHIKFYKVDGKYTFYDYIGANGDKDPVLTLEEIRNKKKEITSKLGALLKAQCYPVSKLEPLLVSDVLVKIRTAIDVGRSISNSNSKGRSKYHVFDAMHKPLLECIESIKKSME